MKLRQKGHNAAKASRPSHTWSILLLNFSFMWINTSPCLKLDSYTCYSTLIIWGLRHRLCLCRNHAYGLIDRYTCKKSSEAASTIRKKRSMNARLTFSFLCDAGSWPISFHLVKIISTDTHRDPLPRWAQLSASWQLRLTILSQTHRPGHMYNWGLEPMALWASHLGSGSVSSSLAPDDCRPG